MATHHHGQRLTGAENLPTLSSEWYVPPGAQQRDGGHGEGFDPLNGRHRVRRRRRSSGGSDGDDASDDEASHEDGSHYSGDSDSDSDSDSEESEDEFFEAADTDVQRKWRRLSLSSPNAPFEDTPHPGPAGAPLSSSSRAQQAETSAKYYAEAYLGGIPPTHADAAARSVDGHKRWWGALQKSSVLSDDDSAHGCDAGGDTEQGAAADEPGGWSHRGDAAVTASLVPELEPFALPSVESVFGEGPSSGPTPFGGFDLHAVGVGMKRSLDAELGLDDDDEGGAPSPASTRTSTPASSRQPSQSGAGSVSESEMDDIADVFDDAESVISSASSERVDDEERGLGGLRRKRGRDRPRASRDTFGEPDKAVVDIVPLEHLDALRARVCSPEPETLDTAGHQLTEQEFQDCLEDPFDNGQGGECEPVVDPFDDVEECGGRPLDCPQVEAQPQPQPQQAPQARRNSHSRRRRPSHGPRSPRGSIASFAQTQVPFGPPQAAVSEDEDACPPPTMALGGPQAYSYQTPLQAVHSRRISDCKASLLRHLSSSGGDVTHPGFLFSLSQLRSLASRAGMDALDHASDAARALEGMWLTLSRPNYHDCLGKNTHRAPQGGEYMYTLGRMSFDMFRPTGLVCSVQGVFNPCNRVDGRRREEVESVPRGLRREMEDGVTCLRSYNIVTAFTVEPAHDSFSAPDGANDNVSRPIRGIQTTYGYVLPDPRTPNRLSVWFTGGTLECNDVGRDGEEWRRIFCGEDGVSSSAGSGSESCDSSTSSGHRGHRGGGMGGALPRRQHLGERARVLAAKLILGASIPERMEDDGTMSYRFSRPIGGHGTAYIDVLYLDDTLRILRGHHGTVYVFARVPGAAPEG